MSSRDPETGQYVSGSGNTEPETVSVEELRSGYDSLNVFEVEEIVNFDPSTGRTSWLSVVNDWIPGGLESHEIAEVVALQPLEFFADTTEAMGLQGFVWGKNEINLNLGQAPTSTPETVKQVQNGTLTNQSITQWEYDDLWRGSFFMQSGAADTASGTATDPFQYTTASAHPIYNFRDMAGRGPIVTPEDNFAFNGNAEGGGNVDSVDLRLVTVMKFWIDVFADEDREYRDVKRVGYR